MLSHPVRITPVDDHLIMLTFHDGPEAVIMAADEEDAFGRTVPGLETVLGGYVFEGRCIPEPSDICGAPVVTTKKFSTFGMIKADEANSRSR